MVRPDALACFIAPGALLDVVVTCLVDESAMLFSKRRGPTAQVEPADFHDKSLLLPPSSQ